MKISHDCGYTCDIHKDISTAFMNESQLSKQ